MANNSNLHRELPFTTLTDYALINLIASTKNRIMEKLNDMGITQIIKRKFNPTQAETLEDSNYQYYDVEEYNSIQMKKRNSISFFHQNIRSFSKNCGQLIAFLSSINHEYDIIMLTEIGQYNIPTMGNVFKLVFNDYNYYYQIPPSNPKGGVAILIKSTIDAAKIRLRNDLEIEMACECTNCQVESLFFEIQLDEVYTIGCIYRHPNGDTHHFSDALRSTITKIKHKGPIVLSGDINISLTSYESSQVKKYIDDLAEMQLIPVITLPTRINDNTATCIDHFYIRQSKKLHKKTLKTGILFSDVSDHLPIFLNIGKIKPNTSERKYIRIHSERNITKFITQLETHDWSNITTIEDTNRAYDTFIKTYIEMYNTSFPLKKVSISRNKDKKWMTKALRLSIQRKNRLYRIKIQNPSLHNINKYKDYNKVLQKCLFQAENCYYLSVLKCKKEGNIKFWKLFGNIINPDKQKKHNLIPKVVYDGKTFTDPYGISNAFNDHFVSIGKKLTEKFDNSSNMRKYMNTNCNESIFLEPIVKEEVMNTINQLKENKAPGPDGISPKIIRFSRDHIAPCLTHIFNLSIQSGQYPHLLKESKVIAIHKKKDRHIPDNYRPISLLDTINKIYEKLLYKRFINFLNTKGLLFLFQFGFRQHHSTSLALTEIVDKIKQSIDNNGYTVGIFLDLCKAFDAVDHKTLLEKLPYYGIRGTALELIKSYLANRFQYTIINGVKSETKAVTCGVPQGSVLGPLLFLLYVNDIENCISSDIPRLFADDTGLFIHGSNLTSIMESAQNVLNKLQDWFYCNKLTLSIPKCSYVIFRGVKRALPNNIPSLHLNNIEIERRESVKYIGVILDSVLSWRQHIDLICTKLNRLFGVFSHLRHKIPNSYARQIYYSTVFPHLNYCLEIYGSCASNLMKKLQTKQNSLMKYLTKKDNQFSTNSVHKLNNILKINDTYELKLMSFVHECLNKTTIPLFHNYFKLQRLTHQYTTRQHSILAVPRKKNKYRYIFDRKKSGRDLE